jgi:hypothetical protein
LFNVSAIGAKQFVVQEAAEITVSSFVNVPSFTLYTIVGRSFPAGAEITTFLAPALMCASAFALDVKKPVHSSTTSTSRSPHGNSSGFAFA